jgi:formamidopyrimidine-DNA glycosylase
MPELPDVEVYKRYVDSTALHQPIEAADVPEARLLDGTSVDAFREALCGASFEATRRHGKHLFVRCSTDRWVGLHFGMSGEPTYYKRDGTPPDYEYARVDFENGYRLGVVMPRKLGRIRLLDDPDAFIAANDLGPDALDLDLDTFQERLSDRRGMIKSALMDQSVIAGLGNVYTDEVLFQAGVHPKTKVQDLDAKALRSLFDAMHDVLKATIDCQADPEQMPADRFMLPHRQGDQKDPYSGADLEKITVSGRTGFYSPARQAAP